MAYFTTGERRGTILLIIIIAIIILAMAIHSGLFHSSANRHSSIPSDIQYTDTVVSNTTDSVKDIKSTTRKTKKKSAESHKRKSGPQSRDYLSEPV